MDGWLTMQGYLIVYDKVAYFRGKPEMVQRGAADKLLARVATGEQEIFCVVDHKMDKLLARTGNGSLVLAGDDRGVLATIKMRSTAENMNLYRDVKDKLYTGGSFRFLDRGTVEEERNGVRVFKELNITEVTVTGLPVYRDTTLTARADGGDAVDEYCRDGYDHWKIQDEDQNANDETQPANGGSKIYYCDK